MGLKINKKTTLAFIAVVFLLFLDKFFKVLLSTRSPEEPIELIRGIFFLELKKNPNIAFSLPFSGPLLIVLIIFLILSLIAWWIFLLKRGFKNKKLPSNIYPLSFLIVGAMLNLSDRIREGGVLDYFDLRYFTVFNIADIMISGSTIALLIIAFLEEGAAKNKKLQK